MPNRLASETSPYLLQHAQNPVDWYPWGQEAFERARAEDKPILLSVGYSACHWCHVMERECFENARIAAVMNERFVNVKVDREERPDVDNLYMTALQAITESGGWPMTMFLTPGGEPFFGGTYFPPSDRDGMPGFVRVLESVSETWKRRHAEVLGSSAALKSRLAAFFKTTPRPDSLREETLDEAYEDLASRFDFEWGGFGQAPKFPPSLSLEVLLRLFHRRHDERSHMMLDVTLQAMARGGLYDQLGGGFHRYSVDAQWALPHFEKMLTDNALLSRLYLLAYQATGEALYQDVACETLDFVAREMTSSEGAFYASQDADTEGREGAYYLWRQDEFEALLGAEDAPLVAALFGVTAEGNFEGRNVLRRERTMAEVASDSGTSPERLQAALERAKPLLLEARSKRPRPGCDEKAIAGWNGLMLKSFAEAARALERGDYLAVAERNAAFLLGKLRTGDRLMRSYKDGQARLEGYLEDYAHVCAGLLALHEATLSGRWLEEALALAKAMEREFWDEALGGFYDTGAHHEALIVRPRNLVDSALPSGSAAAAEVLFKLAHLTGDGAWADKARAVLASAGDLLERYPAEMGSMLCVLDLHLASVREVVLVGRASESLAAMRHEVFAPYHPYMVVTGGDESALSQLAQAVPLLRDRHARDGQAVAYVCEQSTCKAPIVEPEELGKLLAQGC